MKQLLSAPPITRTQYLVAILFGVVVFGLSYFDAKPLILDYMTQPAQVSYFYPGAKNPCYVYLSIKRSGSGSSIQFKIDESRALAGNYSVYVRKPGDLLIGAGTNYTLNAYSSKDILLAQYGFKDTPYIMAESFATDGTINGNVIELPESFSDLFIPYNPAISKVAVLVGKKSITLSGVLPNCNSLQYESIK